MPPTKLLWNPSRIKDEAPVVYISGRVTVVEYDPSTEPLREEHWPGAMSEPRIHPPEKPRERTYGPRNPPHLPEKGITVRPCPKNPHHKMHGLMGKQ